MTKKIVVMNQKGGVGKTTTTLNLSATLARLGKKVLAVDLDAQANLTRALGVDAENSPLTMTQVFKAEAALEDIKVSVFEGLFDLAPANITLASIDTWLSAKDMAREYALKEALDASTQNYDIVILDCPPAFSIVSINAMMFGSHLLIPVSTDSFSRYGTAELITRYKACKKYNPHLKLLGVFANMYDARNKIDQAALTFFQTRYSSFENEGDKMFKTVIKRSVAIKESPGRFKDLAQHEPEHPINKDYQELSQEVLERLES